MYTSYSSLGGRSRSTADIFKARSLDDPSRPATTYGCTSLSSSGANEACRRLIETSTPTQAETPRTSFVKKLVASLERKQKEIGACKVADHEFLIARHFERDETKEDKIVEQQQHTCTRSPVTHLEDQLEEEREDEEYDDFSELEDEPPSKFWSTEELVAPPIISDLSDTKAKSSFQRSIKNMFSSLLNWRASSKSSLPKGSREYYATRESLGDEMGAFRKHTMPRLIERATSKSRLDRSRGESSRRNRREFSNLIAGEPRSIIDETVASKPSIATIHPVYGTLRRMPRVQEIEIVEPRKVQLPAVPPTEHRHHRPILPSKLRELHKRATSLEPGKISRASSIVYSVPNRRRLVPHKFSPPEYENFKQIVGSDNKRIRSSMFTKF